jgi:hypothetical protein
MLASTVQFSNNDQPPTTPSHHGSSSLGPAVRGSFPQDPTACPTLPPPRLAFHAEAVLATEAGRVCRVVNVPPMSNHPRALV